MSWLAILSSDASAVIAASGLAPLYPVSWKQGIETVYARDADQYVFVTPAIRGWTLVVGQWAGFWGIETIITDLSGRFHEVQAFATERIVEYHHWMLARDGQMLRSFAWLGESIKVIKEIGQLTPIELALKIDPVIPKDHDAFSAEGDTFRPPNELYVMQVAGDWSINPTFLDDKTPAPGPGTLCTPATRPA
ncbi:MAG: hypothetical protein ACR2M0_04800 [Chloroflexia bacterium]